jgi:2-dehydro-3-deoxyphosphogluconate aldolase/(4S)-4-hydroxy-2-oxoglutarate aldolase
MQNIYERIGALRIVPVIAIEDLEAALPLADALVEGGLPAAEITFRTKAAAMVIEKIAKQRPEVLVGAGTVLTEENLRQAVGCGAAFGVAPGFNPKIVSQAIEMQFPFSPGVLTPSEIEGALSLGVNVLKFFPAGAAGGVNMLKSIAAPYAHMGVKFLPTGGVKQDNLRDYLEVKAVLAVGGTWIASREDIASKRWSMITDNCRNAVALVKDFEAALVATHLSTGESK